MRILVRSLLLGLAGLAVIASAGDQTVPPPTPPPPGDIEDFVPSEKISADDAVAFPVDI